MQYTMIETPAKRVFTYKNMEFNIKTIYSETNKEFVTERVCHLMNNDALASDIVSKYGDLHIYLDIYKINDHNDLDHYDAYFKFKQNNNYLFESFIITIYEQIKEY